MVLLVAFMAMRHVPSREMHVLVFTLQMTIVYGHCQENTSYCRGLTYRIAATFFANCEIADADKLHIAGDVSLQSASGSTDSPAEELAVPGHIESCPSSPRTFVNLAPAGPEEAATPVPEASATMPLVRATDVDALDS